MTGVTNDRAPRPLPFGGLCSACEHVRVVASAKGSTFLLCRRSADDPRYPKYPPQPVFACRGFTPGERGQHSQSES
jgi:hypothetical protein